VLSLKRAFFAILAAVAIESSLSFLFPLSFAFPHLSIAVLVFTALQEGPAAGFRLGLWLGFLLDALSVERFGFFTALYAFVGFSCGALRGKVFAEAFISQWLIPSTAYLFVIFATAAAFPAYEDAAGLAGFFSLVKGSPFFATAITSPFVFMLCEKTLRTRKPGASSSFLR
jgi:rod shape-determining protein MreD